MENQETALQDNSSCVGELDAYLADCNVNNCMQFWQENVNKFTKLPADMKHRGIPSTSAAMKRCFSAAISEMLRNWKIMLIAKCNKDFMDK